MPIRDLLLTVAIFGALPVCFFRPWIGLLVWNCVGIMAPQWLVWDFARSIPFAQLTAAATLPGLLLSNDRRSLPSTLEAWLLYALWAWFVVTTFFAVVPERAWDKLSSVSKSLLFVVIALSLFQDRRRLRYLLLVIAASIGFYGLKGGVFALLTRTETNLVIPNGSSIGGNTGFGLALVMTLPLLFYLAAEEPRRWLRYVLQATFAASIAATVFTYSRGAFLGLAAVLALLALKRRRPAVLAAMLAIGVVVSSVAPQRWFERVATIANYQTDDSAMSRLETWRLTVRFALDHPLFGGGFWSIENDDLYRTYLDSYTTAFNAHSIWFNMLGEHGFPGLALFVGLISACWLSLRALRKSRDGVSPSGWIVSYSHMLELALLGYVVSGTFLSVAYLELFYQLVGAIILLHVIARRETAPEPAWIAVPHGEPGIGVNRVWDRWVR